MAKAKLPKRAKFRSIQPTPQHEYPFHIVGTLVIEDRNLLMGVTEEDARKIYEMLGVVFNETHSV